MFHYIFQSFILCIQETKIDSTFLNSQFHVNGTVSSDEIERDHITNQGALSIQPKIPVISVGTSNGTDHFGLVRPEYSGPALKVVHFDRSGHFGRLD